MRLAAVRIAFCAVLRQAPALAAISATVSRRKPELMGAP